MPAYVILFQESEIRDPEALAEYRSVSAAGRGDFKLVPKVVYGAIDALEGEPPQGVVMLEFPSMEEARAWYHSPGYQAALPHRLRAADYRMIIVEGV